ncbi:unnamed protein product [Prorocentrum cordatum]|uniref:Uncharacterized protein n=2 Tax=Prorocentrum cordatum TaxID=2364126 RepID=A0ABN9WT70_9DINO|nr:unnamed protein product [Polarella glacialis]
MAASRRREAPGESAMRADSQTHPLCYPFLSPGPKEHSEAPARMRRGTSSSQPSWRELCGSCCRGPPPVRGGRRARRAPLRPPLVVGGGRMQAAPGSRAALRRLLGSCPALHRHFVGVPLSAGAIPHAPLTGQVRHAGRRRKSIVEDGVEELSRTSAVVVPPRTSEEEAESGFALPEVPAEILDAWEKDEMAQEALGMFSSEEFQGKGVMSHRDVARMLELMGCDRLTFLRMLNDEGDDDDDEGADESGKGKGRQGRKGDLLADDEPWAPRGGGKGGKKGVKGLDDRMDSDDSDDEPEFGKGGGKKGYKGSKGKSSGFQRRGDDSDDELDFDRRGGKNGHKGSKGKSGGFRDDSDDEDFAFPRGKGKGGKGGGKGKGKGGFGKGGFGGF